MKSYVNPPGATVSSAVLLLVLFFTIVTTDVQKTLTASQQQAIEDIVETVRRCRHIPGMSMSVVSGEKILFKAGFGLADVENNMPVQSDTLFPIGSTTKAFTSTLLSMLIERNPDKINWDIPVSKILGPDFTFYNKTLTEQISLRDLLSHRTGIPGYFVPLMAGFPENMSRQELVRTIRYLEPSAPLRTSFQYNNYMYMLAGHVAEVFTGSQWEHLNNVNLFEHLGMTSSKYVHDLKEDTVMAEGYTLVGGVPTKLNKSTLHQVDVASPAGAIVSNADDMSQWLQFHLRRGMAPSGDYLLTPEALQETYREHMPSPFPISQRDMWKPKYPVSDVHIAYDLGWITSYYRGYKRVWHSGGITNYKSMVWLYPEADIAMFICENGPGDGGSTWALILILQYVTDVLLGETPWLNTTSVCSFPEPWATVAHHRRTFPDDAHVSSLDPYVGTYSHPGFGDVNITHNTKTGRLELHMGRFMEAELFYSESRDVFHTKFFGELWYIPERIPVTFQRAGGRVDVLSMPFDSPYESASRVKFVRRGIDTSNMYPSFTPREHECSSVTGLHAVPGPHLLMQLVLIIVSITTY